LAAKNKSKNTMMGLTVSLERKTHDVISEALDAVVLSQLKNSRETIILINSVHPDDIKQDKKLLKALNLLIEYYGG
jgi:predicted Zn-dependent protease with MMP-like domain